MILNLYGFLLLILLFGPMIATFGLTKSKPALLTAFFTGAVLCIIADILIRNKNVNRSKKLIHPYAGGHIFFVPMWVLSFLLASFVLVIVIRRTMF